MALTELQQPSKGDFYIGIRQKVSRLYEDLMQAQKDAIFLAAMDADTLDNMGVPAAPADEGLRLALVDLRSALTELSDFFDGSATSQTVVPKTIFEEFRNF